MLDVNTLNSDITKIDVMQLQRMISMENKIFEDMYRLMLYDNSQPNAENNNVVKAYLQSQIKVLNHIEKLINKYQLVLDELNKPTKIVEKDTTKSNCTKENLLIKIVLYVDIVVVYFSLILCAIMKL